MIGSVLAVVTNYDFSANADDLKARLAPYFETLLIDNSSPIPPRSADVILPNRHYTGLWNESVRLAIERDKQWLFFVAADVQIPDAACLAANLNRVSKKADIGVWTPSLRNDSRAYFTACFGRGTRGLRECYIVEGFCFLARTKVLAKLYPVDYEFNCYGWGIDVMTAYCAYRMGYKVAVDDRVTIYHPPSIHVTSTVIPQEQQIRFMGDAGRDFQHWADERLRCEHELVEIVSRKMANIARFLVRARNKFNRWYVTHSGSDRSDHARL